MKSHLRLAPFILAGLLAGSASAAPIRVAIFEGRGSSDRGVNATGQVLEQMADVVYERVQADRIRAGELANFDVVIFSGGSGSRQANTLEEAGREQVIEHLRRGGGYIGICAGAYLAGSGREVYLGFVPFKHHLPWRLGGGYVDMEFTPAGRQALGPDQSAKVSVRYGNGAIFVDDDGNMPDFAAHGIEVLAHFRTAVKEGSEVMIDKAAIMAGTHLSGRFVLISPHPETIGDDHLHWMVRNAVRHAANRPIGD